MDKETLLEHLKKEGVSESILRAFARVPREEFMLPEYKTSAYEDNAFPIRYNATISQPSTIAFMLKLLDVQKGQSVLEIGSGSGYVLALLAEIVGTSGRIYGVEIIKELAERLQAKLGNYQNIRATNESGSNGLIRYAPYERILISASCPSVPMHLAEQLAETGIIVASVKNSIVKIAKEKNKTFIREYPGFVFVPLRE